MIYYIYYIFGIVRCENSVHSIGQTKPVQMKYLFASNTADDIVLALMNKKNSIVQSVRLLDSADQRDFSGFIRINESLARDLPRCDIIDYDTH